MTGSATLDTFCSCHPSILLFLWDELLGRLGFLGVISSAIARIIVATEGVIICHDFGYVRVGNVELVRVRFGNVEFGDVAHVVYSP